MICRHRISFLINYKYYISIVNNKHFHLSHLNLVRRPRKASNFSINDDHEAFSSGAFHDPPKIVDVNKNFYGVEGDEGVIYAEEIEKSENSIEKSDKSIQALQNNTSEQQSMGEEYKSFYFGAVRLDTENRATYIPRRSRKLSKKELNNQEKNLEQSNDITVENEPKHLNTNQNILNEFSSKNNYEHNSTFINEKNFSYDESEQNKSSSSSYLNSIRPFTKTHLNSTKKSNDLTKDNQYYELNEFKNRGTTTVSDNLTDENYVLINSNCYDIHTEISAANNIKNQQVEEKKEITLKELSETNEHSTANSLKSEDFLSESSRNNHLANLDVSKVSESFIDKHYFNENYVEHPSSETKTVSDNYIEDQYFKESNLNTSESNYEAVLKSQNSQHFPLPKNLNDILTPISEEPEAAVFESSKSLDENKSAICENSGQFNGKNNAQNLSNEANDFMPFENNSANQERKLQRENLLKMSGKNKFETSTISEISKDLTKLSRQGSSGTTTAQEKEPSSENKIETALDFVKKLKGNKFLSDDVKKGISAKKERKVDIKGFRILKHQVPSLEYFTRDEMLELLKESVLYTDNDVVVLNKPYNLVMHESNTSEKLACLSRYLDDLAQILDKDTNSPKLMTVHRLDKETTGCLLLARNDVSAARLKSLFAQRKILKTYWIITTQVPDPMDGIIDMPISEGKIENKSRMVLHPNLPKDINYTNHSKAGKQAITQYSVIAVSGNAALVEVKPETGIKHQIRVHFGFGLGCPILGDHKYSHLDRLVPQKLPSDLLQRLHVRQSKVRHIPLHIHSKHILIPQFLSERNLFVTAPLPRHMVENLRFLKFKKK